MAGDPDVTTRAQPQQEDVLEEIDNPIERLKLLSGNDDEIAKYLDAIEVTSPREREMMHEISRTQPLARPDLFPQAHRNMVEALESLARHGYHGTVAGKSMGPLRAAIRWGVQLVARYLVVSHIRDVSTKLRNLYGLREIQALPGSDERRELRRARFDADRMVDALQTRELALPAFLLGGAALPLFASLGRVTGLFERDALGDRHRRRGHARGARRLVGDPSRRRSRVAAHPARDARAPANALEHDRLVRQAAQGLDPHVRHRLRRADARLLDHRPDPRRDRPGDLSQEVLSASGQRA